MTDPKIPHSVAARRLMRHARSAMLATALAEGARGEAGWPYGSLVTVALDCDASPILLFSDLSDHTRNIKADPRATLLFEAASRRANPQTGPPHNLATRQPLNAQQGPQQRGFPRPGRPDQRHHMPARSDQIDTLQHFQRTIALMQVADLDHRGIRAVCGHGALCVGRMAWQ